MTALRSSRVTFVLAAFLLLPSARSTALEADLGEARKLYTAAAFEEALAVLDRIPLTEAEPEEIVAVHRYRAGCLLALGRVADAERSLEAVARLQPELDPGRFDESPRMREAFAAVRTRVLPLVVRDLFADARTAYANEAPDAAERFERLLSLLADPALADHQSDGLKDMKTLAAGFAELLKAQTTEEAAPPPPVVPQRTFYTSEDAGVLPPRVISQHIPRPPVLANRMVAFKGTMAIELTISSEGLVETAIVTQPLNPIYDAMVVEAAKRWRYEPALLNGTPVEFRRKVEIVVRDE